MKVIFLDVDGVLNCIGWLRKNEGKPYDQSSIDPSKVELLADMYLPESENYDRFVVKTRAKMDGGCIQVDFT